LKKALLAFKDRQCIADADWADVVETFQLGSDCSIHYIRKERKNMNDKYPASKTPGKRGAELNLADLLKHLLTVNPPKDPSKKLLLKIGFDGATVTTGKRKQLEAGGVQVIIIFTDQSKKVRLLQINPYHN
jgi:hypothetical protein